MVVRRWASIWQAPLSARLAGARRQRVALGLAGLLLLGVAAAATATFVWPSGPATDLRFNLGRLAQFPPGTVTTLFAPIDGSSAPVSNVAYLRHPGWRVSGSPSGLWHTFHVVRLDSGEILALSARDPHLGRTMPYRPSFNFDGREGWFRDPCHGETYDLAGYRVFGPTPRGRDRLHVEVIDGSVTVDLGDVTAGDRSPPPSGYEPQRGGVFGPLHTR